MTDQLIELATEQGDLAELRRLADQGNATAAEVLDELVDTNDRSGGPNHWRVPTDARTESSPSSNMH